MKIKDLTTMAACLAVLIICSKISLDIGIIALTLQTFAVSIIGFILKWKKATIVFITYIIMGLIGIPVFSSAAAGYAYVLKPSFGFIIGFLLSGFITGSRVLENHKWVVFVKAVLGLLVIDLVGLVYMYIILKFYMLSENATVLYVLQAGLLPFIAKDLISVGLSALISIRLVPALDSIGVYEKRIKVE